MSHSCEVMDALPRQRDSAGHHPPQDRPDKRNFT